MKKNYSQVSQRAVEEQMIKSVEGSTISPMQPAQMDETGIQT
jgi:hypothetical protein